MTALAAALVNTTPREKAGARTGARFSFQIHVSLAKVLDAHQAGGDYRAVFDYFDDLVMLGDSSLNPGDCKFYQIKGKEPGNWSVNALALDAEGNTPRTIIGKMYHHATNFPLPLSAIFLTNAPLIFELADGTKSGPDHMTIALTDLSTSDRKILSDALDLDFPKTRNPNEASLIKFERTDIPLKGHDFTVQGKLAGLLEAENKTVGALSGLYRFLIASITAKSNDTRVCTTLADVFSFKSLSRSDFDAAFSQAELRQSILQNWDIIDEELKGDGHGSIERIQIKNAAIAYLRDSSKRTTEAAAMTEVVLPVVHSLKNEILSCTNILHAVTLVALRISNAGSSFDPSTFKAVLLTEVYEVIYASK